VLLEFRTDYEDGSPGFRTTTVVINRRFAESVSDSWPSGTADRLADIVGGRQQLLAIAGQVERWLSDFFTPRAARALGRWLALPVIWVSSTPGLPSGRSAVGIDDANWKTDVAAEMLGVPSTDDRAVFGSVINGYSLTFRHFRRAPEDQMVSQYVILRGQSTDDAKPSFSGRLELAAALTDLEAYIAVSLQNAQTDLDIWRNHALLFAEIADRGFRLWDGLSTHLPVHQLRQMGAVHRAIDLLHQIFLQGVADLADFVNYTSQTRARVDEIAQVARDTFDDQLSERLVREAGGVLTGIIDHGPLVRATREAEQVQSRAVQVRATYAELISTISSAYGERRLRESSNLQNASAVLSVGLAIIGFVTVFDFGIAQVVIAVVFGVGGALGLVALGFVLRTGRLSSRATRVFRRQYSPTRGQRGGTGVWWLIKESSTDALDRVAYTANVGDWRHHDRRLSEGFARAWDQAVRMPKRRRSVSMRRDASALARQTEQWALQALLLTERANKMYAYPLPVLTCLYRMARRLPGQATSNAFETDGVNMVADTDFARSLQRHGFTWQDAFAIDEWLTSRTPRTAREALGHILELGLGDDLDDVARTTILDRIWLFPVP
jgi:hypothetical protein